MYFITSLNLSCVYHQQPGVILIPPAQFVDIYTRKHNKNIRDVCGEGKTEIVM